MNRFLRLLLCVIAPMLLGFAPAVVQAQVSVLFDDIAGTGVRPVDPARYASQGLLLETSGAGLFVNGPSAFTPSPPNWLYGSQTPTGANADANITLRFVSPVDGSPAVTDDVRFAIADGDDVGPWTVRGYDVAGNQVSVFSRTNDDTVRVTGRVFHRVVFTPSGDFDGIDSLSFSHLHRPPQLESRNFVPFGSSWRWWHPITNIDPMTSDPDFHTTWYAGAPDYFMGPSPALLGYGAIDLRAITTNIGTPASNQRHAAYFTTTFDVADASLVRTLAADVLIDDGAFVYLNGRLVATHNMLAGAMDTYRQGAAGFAIHGINTETAIFTLFLDPADLVSGTNVLSVSVHNDSPTSSDLGFDMQLYGSLRVVPEPGAGLLSLLSLLVIGTAAGRRVIFERFPIHWQSQWHAPGALLQRGCHWLRQCFAPHRKSQSRGCHWLRQCFPTHWRAAWSGIIVIASASSAAAQNANVITAPFHLVNSRARLAIPNPLAANVSGVTYSPVTDSLFLVDNGLSAIYEFDRAGAYRRTITTTGFDDAEAINWLDGDRFALLEEKTTHINVISIGPATTTIDKSVLPLVDVIRPDLVPGDPSSGSLNPTGGNTGLEGVVFDPATNRYYVAKEKTAGTPGDHAINIFVVNPDGSASVLFDPSRAHGASTMALTSLATDVSDLHLDRRTGHLLVMSQESRRVIEVTATGEVVASRLQPGTQIEGVTLTPDGNHLFVVGESREFFHYETAPELSALIRPGARWKYRDDGSNQGTAWRERFFNDDAWLEGAAELGYGDADEATIVDCGPAANCLSLNNATTYFRHEFTVPFAHRVEELTLGIQRDDAAAVYLNGVLVYRDTTLPANPLFNRYAAAPALSDPDEDFFIHVSVDPALLRFGPNSLAVEVHQFAATDVDVSFNAQLIARYMVIPEPSGVVLAIGMLAVIGMVAHRRKCSR